MREQLRKRALFERNLVTAAERNGSLDKGIVDKGIIDKGINDKGINDKGINNKWHQRPSDVQGHQPSYVATDPVASRRTGTPASAMRRFTSAIVKIP